MNIKNRFIIIVILISFITLFVFLINIYEHNLFSKKKTVMVNDKYNVFKKIDGFKLVNQNRYITFYEKNKHLSFDNIVTYVNIGLDKDYYSYVNEADINKNNLILVNKYNKLDKDYIPDNLENIDNKYFINGNNDVRSLKKEAKIYFEKLSIDSINNQTPVYGQSAYRSFERQKNIYNNSLKTYGKSKTDTEIARPGFSEHQTGLAIDVSSNKSGNMLNFSNTSSYLWMINNAHKYGFILRYDNNKEKIHGYINEPWHYRYVGIKVACDIHDNYSNLTYDEYFYKFIENKKD